jgi:hypothetical protein
MSKLFDPVSLLNAPLEESATSRDPLPPGEVLAQIMKLSFAEGISQKNREPWFRMNVHLEIQDRDYLAGYSDGSFEKATTLYGVMYEKNESGTGIAVGPNKNVKLGQLRAAAGVNGRPLNDLIGQFIRILVINKPHQDDESVILDEVKTVTKA